MPIVFRSEGSRMCAPESLVLSLHYITLSGSFIVSALTRLDRSAL
jgi:hypothetical protein